MHIQDTSLANFVVYNYIPLVQKFEGQACIYIGLTLCFPEEFDRSPSVV